jgi:hypothetical protein
VPRTRFGGPTTEDAMALRSYTDREGSEWRVWRVVPDEISFTTLVESYRDGWLCFERTDGSERRRLSMTQVPLEWEDLSDERLDMLRRMGEPATRRSVTETRIADGDGSAMESAQRDAREPRPGA